MIDGITDLPWWGELLCILLTTHITIVAVTVYLHRCQAHRAIELHSVISHFFRFWLWLTTGQVTREWVSVHRKHHARTEGEDDPHSPFIYGINKVLWENFIRKPLPIHRLPVTTGTVLLKTGSKKIYTPVLIM